MIQHTSYCLTIYYYLGPTCIITVFWKVPLLQLGVILKLEYQIAGLLNVKKLLEKWSSSLI